VFRSNERGIVPLSATALPEQSAAGEAEEREIRKKEGWPDFPFFWIKRPDMSSLQQIASRLKDKMHTHLPSGVRGETTAVEKQIIEHISVLQQQVGEVHDAVQAALQIIDDNRPSQRLKRAGRWVRRILGNSWDRMERSIAYRIVAAVGALITLWFLGRVVISHFRLFGK
jgi:hypothetical protein